MKKLAFLFVLLSTLALSATNKEIEDYKTTVFKSHKQASIKSVKVISREPMDGFAGWEAVVITIEVALDKGNGKKQLIKFSDTVFVNGDIIADDIANPKKQKSAKESYKPTPDASYYDNEHLVAGNKNAKNKVLVFSDPLCPFCRDMVPDIIAAGVKNPSKLAVYHYSFPLLSIHPSSEHIVKAEISQRANIKNKAEFLTKLYGTEVAPNETDETKVAAKLSAELGLKIQKSDMDKKDVQKEYDEEQQRAFRLLVRGTPTIFINGELDQTKTKIQQLLKEMK
ncbi:MAG TPA: thioredoxin domain-containing protein [Campylobacterales bacterium]|nr:thioredoxin domain-containing protein [Campylobacterales bacterium]